MSSQTTAWGLAPDHGETPHFPNVFEFALGVYGHMAHVQREVGALSAAQHGIEEQIDATRTQIGAAEGRLGEQIVETEARLSDRIRESETRMTCALEASEAKSESMITRVLQEIDARSEVRFSRMEARFDAIDAKFERVDARFDAIDARMDRMDARMDKMDARFDKSDARVDQLEDNLLGRIQSSNDKISALKARLDKVFWVASGGGIVLGLAYGWKPIFERMGGLAGL